MNKPVLTPRLILAIVFVYLGLTWSLIIAVDFLNLFDWQRFSLNFAPLPFFWYEIYSEGRWTERLQWLFLAIGLWAASRLFLLARKDQVRPAYVAGLLLSCGLLLMLVEDSLNLRHIVADTYLVVWFGDPLARSTRLAWELAFYSTLAFLMAGGLYVLWRHFRFPRQLWLLLIPAYAVYGMVGFASAARRVGDWQERLGDWIIEALGLSSMPAWSIALRRIELTGEIDPEYTHTLGYLLTDHLLEESVELIAAGLLAAAMLGVWRNLQNNMLSARGVQQVIGVGEDREN